MCLGELKISITPIKKKYIYNELYCEYPLYYTFQLERSQCIIQSKE